MKKNNVFYLLMSLVGLLVLVILVLLFKMAFVKEEEVIYFVSKTSSENSTFWHSVERGVQVAADELGVDLVFVGPEREIDLQDQIDLVRQGIDQEPMALILAASDYHALSQVAQEAVAAGIPFLTVDSDVKTTSSHSFIATDNVAAARLLGNELAKQVQEKGLVGIISHLEGATSAMDRERGFKEAIKTYKGMDLVEVIYYSRNDSQIAYEQTIKMIQENPSIKGLFGTNEATLIGIARAVDDLGLAGNIKVVGFDISDTAASYIEKGVICSIIVQRPFNMGYESVMEAYGHAKGKISPRTIAVDVVLVNKINLFDEENQKFIIPFLE